MKIDKSKIIIFVIVVMILILYQYLAYNFITKDISDPVIKKLIFLLFLK